MQSLTRSHHTTLQQGDTGRGAYVKAPSAATHKVQRGVSCINIQEEFGGVSLTHSLQVPPLSAASFPHKSLLSTRHLPLLVPDATSLWQPAGQATWGAPHREAPASAVHLHTKRLCRTVYFQGHIELNHQRQEMISIREWDFSRRADRAGCNFSSHF